MILQINKILLVLSFFAASAQAQDLQRFEFIETKMGAPFGLIFYAKDSTIAKQLAKQAYIIVDSLNLAFSDYLPHSEVSLLKQKNGWQPLSMHLFAILLESQNAWQKSDGAFDVTLGRLTKLWRKTKKDGRLPTKKVLKTARAGSGMQYLKLDVNTQSIYFENKANLDLDLGGIGKGYAAQQVFDYFKREGIKSVLVNAAGNMAIGDPPPNKTNWSIGLEAPEGQTQDLLKLSNAAVSTSGDAYQFIQIKNKKYAHILNPKTGLGLKNSRQVSIICTNATQADWLSTACTILPLKKALALAKRESAEIIIFEHRKNKIHKYSSSGILEFLK